ncbi:MAG: hypothetical protein WBP81_30375 [Solirubrobacteraceae bacterium]
MQHPRGLARARARQLPLAAHDRLPVLRAGALRGGRAWFVEAFKLNRTHIRNLYRLAQSRRHQGELVRAQRAAAEVRRLWFALAEPARQREAKTFAKASYLLGKLLADRDPRAAIEPLQQAAEHDPSDTTSTIS